MSDNNKLIRNSTAEFRIFSAQGAENMTEARYKVLTNRRI